MKGVPSKSTLFPYTKLLRSRGDWCPGEPATGRRPPWRKRQGPRRRSKARPPSPRRPPAFDGYLVEVVEVLQQNALGRGAHPGLLRESATRDDGDALPARRPG